MIKIWSRQLLMIKPDLNPYLLASRSPRKVKLQSAEGVSLLYTNIYEPLILSDELSGAELGTGAFNISFTFTPDTSASSRKLFEVPGLVSFSYNWQTGYGLIFNLEGIGDRYIPTSEIDATGTEITLIRADDSSVVLGAGTSTYTYAGGSYTCGQLQIYAKDFKKLSLTK